MKVLTCKDRVHVKIGEGMEAVIAPISYAAKIELNESTKIVEGKPEIDFFKSQCILLKHGLKDIKGFKTYDGEDYKLEFEASGELKDECLSDVLNMDLKPELMTAMWKMVNGNLETLEGVEFEVKPGKRS